MSGVLAWFLLGFLALVSMALASMGALVVGASAASAASGPCAAPVIGQARVVVVVDDGEGGADHAVATCVVVPRGSKGSLVLAARAARLGTAAPSHAGSGLLCTIDSFPASQCADTGSGSYWANFSGTDGVWNYSSYNPFIRRVCDGDVEGWRYVVQGTGAAGDPQPRLDPASVRPADAWGCDEPSAAPASGGGAGAPGSIDAAAASGSSADASPTADGSPSGSIDPAIGVAGGQGRTGSSGASANDGVDGVDGVDATVLATHAAGGSSGGTALLGAGIVVAIIVVLGAAALVRSRRRA